jgi:hypothetical protein
MLKPKQYIGEIIYPEDLYTGFLFAKELFKGKIPKETIVRGHHMSEVLFFNKAELNLYRHPGTTTSLVQIKDFSHLDNFQDYEYNFEINYFKEGNVKIKKIISFSEEDNSHKKIFILKRILSDDCFILNECNINLVEKTFKENISPDIFNVRFCHTNIDFEATGVLGSYSFLDDDQREHSISFKIDSVDTLSL